MNKIDDNIKKIILNLDIPYQSIFEALTILKNCCEPRFNEFLTYYNSGKVEQCRSVLDVAKSDLVESNKMIHTEEDYFGSPYLKINRRI